MERGGSETMVGGIGQVDYTVYDAFEYAALGHIHRAYPVGRKEVRFAGTPLCYHMNETRQEKKGYTWPEYREALREGKSADDFILTARYTPVFNAEQVEGMPPMEPIQDHPDIAMDELVNTLSENMGVEIVLATGRGYLGTETIRRQLGEGFHYIICFGGALVADYATGSPRIHRFLTEEDVASCIRIANDLDLHVQIYQGDEVIFQHMTDFAKEYCAYQKLPWRTDEKLLEHDLSRVPKVLIYAPPEQEEACKRLVAERLPKHLHALGSKPGFIEIGDIGVTKGSAVKALAEQLDDASYDCLRTQCGDHGRNLQIKDDDTVDKTTERADYQRQQQAGEQAPAETRLRQCDRHTGQTRDRAAGNIDAGRDDDRCLGNGQNADDSALFQQVRDIIQTEEVFCKECCDAFN